MATRATLNGTTFTIPGSRWETVPIVALMSVVNWMSTAGPWTGSWRDLIVTLTKRKA